MGHIAMPGPRESAVAKLAAASESAGATAAYAKKKPSTQRQSSMRAFPDAERLCDGHCSGVFAFAGQMKWFSGHCVHAESASSPLYVPPKHALQLFSPSQSSSKKKPVRHRHCAHSGTPVTVNCESGWHVVHNLFVRLHLKKACAHISHTCVTFSKPGSHRQSNTLLAFE